VSVTDQVTAVLPGLDGLARIGRVMAAWRTLGAAGPFGAGVPAVTRVRDLDPPGDGLPEGVPVRSNVLTWWLADGSRVIARPSGTEPKLKVYLEARAAVSGEGAAGLAAARADAAARIEALKVAIQKAIDAVA
jgi:phosphomannomutase